MPETAIEFVKRHLDLEEQTEEITRLPADFYSKVSDYTRLLIRVAGPNNSEMTNRLALRQQRMLESMVSSLLAIRAKKAVSRGLASQLLPEERYVCLAEDTFKSRFETFVESVSAGQPSFVDFAQRAEVTRSSTIRVLKPVTEIVGIDLRRYGPYNPNDLATLPAANAAILIANGDAAPVLTRDES